VWGGFVLSTSLRIVYFVIFGLGIVLTFFFISVDGRNGSCGLDIEVNNRGVSGRDVTLLSCGRLCWDLMFLVAACQPANHHYESIIEVYPGLQQSRYILELRSC